MIEEVKVGDESHDQMEGFVANESGHIVYEDSPDDRDMPRNCINKAALANTSESRSIYKPSPDNFSNS